MPFLTRHPKKVDSRNAGHWVVAANLLPHEQQAVREGMLEKWDYSLRRLGRV